MCATMYATTPINLRKTACSIVCDFLSLFGWMDLGEANFPLITCDLNAGTYETDLTKLAQKKRLRDFVTEPREKSMEKEKM